ncbi:MAG: GUN4 N-terminal ARM-like repeat domain-containing protein, partial [Cyanobacteria bacterium]|nr:GUN4 N-terminal ARM-like repeat domain-containing protein [Cyanobacteriota bacterium]
MSSPTMENPTAPQDAIEPLKTALQSSPPQKQLPLIQTLITAGEPGYPVLVDFLKTHGDAPPTLATGRAYQYLYGVTDATVEQFLAEHFPKGIVPLSPDCQGDYGELQTQLAAQDFEAADRLTLHHLCELTSPEAVKRKWLYFTEVAQLPKVDLQTLDQLWQIYSEGKFGFTPQRQIWLGVGRNWERLWPKIAWKKANVWTRYPGEFIWDLSAPPGHLPLSNQLRGVRMMEALLNHPACV